MAVIVTIQGTEIEFPTSGESPNWAPAIVEFAQAVEAAINSSLGDFDVFPQTFILSNNANTNLDIPNLNFPIAEVRSAFIRYAAYRSTNTNSSFDSGEMVVTYDSLSATWYLERESFGNSDTDISFDITPAGQIRITTTSLSGTNYSGRIAFSAQALTQT